MDDISTELIVDPWVHLRPVVRDSVEYIELCESVKEVGFLNSISVRPSPRQPDHYEIIDGLWRMTCARELGLSTIPCIVKHDVSDDDILVFQVQANAIRPKTKPVDFARRIRRIQKAKPDITLQELSNILNKSPTWITLQLGLLRLDPSTQKAVNRGEICLGNAYMLAAIPPRLRDTVLDKAKLMPSIEFKVLAAGIIKQFKEAVKKGRMEDYYTAEFEAQSYLRSLAEVKGEYDECLEAPLVMTAAKCKTALDGWVAALKWVLHLDLISVEQQKIATLGKARQRWEKGA